MPIETRSFGGNGPVVFPIQAVKSIGFRAGRYVDALLLNGARYGGRGGTESVVLDFRSDEYIRRIAIRHGRYVDGIELETSAGRTLRVGGQGGVREELTNVRVLGFGGSHGTLIDRLGVQVITNYTEATTVERGQSAITDLFAPGESIERFISREVSRLTASVRIMETVFSASAGGESKALGNFIGKLTASTSVMSTSRNEIRNEVRVVEQQSERRTFTVQAGMVGVEIVPVDVLREADGFSWLFPTGPSEILSLPLDAGLPPLTAAYDLTGVLSAQVPAMAGRREKRNDFDYYRAVAAGATSTRATASTAG
jgi:hypothetical protein